VSKGDVLACMVIAGGQWGDEGKGKIVAYLALTDKPRIIARAGVGPNAGHTVYYRGQKFGLRQVPCGFVYEGARLLIGPGVLVDPRVVLEEVEITGVADRFGVDGRCTVIEPSHIEQDRASEHLKGKIGTTGTGCGPANAARVNRMAKLAAEVAELKRFLADVPREVNNSLRKEETVLIEGSQGFLLSLIYGTYPYVTSKDTTASTLAADIGVGPTKIDDVLLVFKSYVSRVGAGPFPTEITQERAEELDIVEFGTVTGRRRRIGMFDFDFAKRAVMINGATQLAITCVDKLFKGALGTRRWDKLPDDAQEFLNKIELELETPVTIISTGPGIDDVIDLRSKKM